MKKLRFLSLILSLFMVGAVFPMEIYGASAPVTKEVDIAYTSTGIVGADGLTDQTRYTFQNGTVDLDQKDYLFLNQGQWYGAKIMIKDGVAMVPSSVWGGGAWNTKTKMELYHEGLDRTILFQMGEKEALVDGKKVTLPAAPFRVIDDAYIPLRFTAEVFGMSAGFVPKGDKGMAKHGVVWLEEKSITTQGGKLGEAFLPLVKSELEKNLGLFQKTAQTGAADFLRGVQVTEKTLEQIETDIQKTKYLGQVGRFALYESVCPILIDTQTKKLYYVSSAHETGGLHPWKVADPRFFGFYVFG